MKLQIIMENDEDYFANKDHKSKSAFIKQLTNKINALRKQETLLCYTIMTTTPANGPEVEQLRAKRYKIRALIKTFKLERKRMQTII